MIHKTKYPPEKANLPFADKQSESISHLKPIDMNYHRIVRRYFLWDNLTRLGRTLEPYCLLQLTLSGSGFFRHGDRESLLPKGRMFLVPIPSPTFYGAYAHQRWDCLWLTFAGNIAFQLVDKINQHSGYLFETDEFPEAAQILVQWYERAVDHNLPDGITLSSQLYEILMGFLRERHSETAPNEKILRQANHLINAHFADPDFGVQQIAKTLGLSACHLIRFFRAYTNQTPGDILRRKRLTHALELVVASSLSMKEIAYRVGYSSPVSFSNAFKNEFGQPPLGYRQQRKKFSQ